jgi:hypothetical protein
MSPWTDFMITAAGASAALAGLVMVAISVNIEKILSNPQLPSRSASTIATLILALVASLAALIPQGMGALGAEVLSFGVCCWFLHVRAAWWMIRMQREKKRPRVEAALGITFGQVQTLPFLIGGLMLVGSNIRGLYWMSAGVIAVLIFSTLNAWILLVEILR